jgi:major membrane immunogen (membrane-anchored lipoprotein)
MMRRGSTFMIVAAALSLAACGDSSAPADGAADGAAAGALKALDDSRIAGLLSAEAKAALDILGQGVRTEIAAYKAQYGHLPKDLSELASLQTARTAAVTAITDALVEQVPFVRRETLEQMAGQFVERAQQRVLDQSAAIEAVVPGESGAKP